MQCLNAEKTVPNAEMIFENPVVRCYEVFQSSVLL